MATALPRTILTGIKRWGTWLKTMCLVGLLAAFALPAISLAADAPRRPNIVVILGDDLGFADLGAFGGEAVAQTPAGVLAAPRRIGGQRR